MLVRRFARNLAVLSIVVPGTTWSLGLGDITVTTALNRPLRAQIKLLSVEPGNLDTMRVRLASQAAFDRVGIERPFVLTELQFNPEQAQGGGTIIEVTTKQPVREPFLNFLVEVEWPNGRLLREYTVLLDPPVFMDEPGGAVMQAPVVASQATAAPAASTSTARPDRQVTRADHGPAHEENAAAVSSSRASASETRGGPVEYNVVPGDTLGEIAQRYLSDDNADLPQMMMAILHANPDAFSQGNINNLKSGVILRIPAGPDVAAVDEQAALAAVSRQTDLWREYKAEVTDAVPSPSGNATTTAAPSPNGMVERTMAATTGRPGDSQNSTAARPTDNKSAGADSKEAGVGSSETGAGPNDAGQLEIMASKDGNAQARAATAGDGNENGKPALNGPLARELAESQRVEIDSLNSKVAELESMVTKQARIISLQSKALADLQRRVDSTEPAAGMQDEQAPTNEGATAKDGVSDASMSKAEPNTGAAGRLMTHAAGTEPMAIPDPAAQAADDAAALSATGLLQEIFANPAMLAAIGGGAVLLLALVWLVVRRAAAKRGETVNLAAYEGERDGDANDAAHAAAPVITEPQAHDGEQPPTPVAINTVTVPASADAKSAADMSEQKPEQGEHALNDDTLAEADVYIAYALYQQAEDLLKEAIGRSPNHEAYRVKLLEAYYAAKNSAGFDAEAQALYESAGGRPGAAWDRVMVMGRDLSPHNPLFRGAAGGSGVQDSTTAPVDTSGEPDRQKSTAANTGSGLAAKDEETVLNTDALRLNATPGDLSGAQAGQTGVSTVSYDDEILRPGASEFDTTAPGGSSETSQTTARLDEGTLDFDLSDLEASDTSDTSRIEADARSSRAGYDAYDFNLLDNVQTQIAPRSERADGESFAGDINLDELQVEASDASTPRATGLKLDEPMNLDDLKDLADDNGVSTKLDLAKAYIDLGDSDGALSTLEEVLEEGDEDQRKEAEVLRRRIA